MSKKASVLRDREAVRAYHHAYNQRNRERKRILSKAWKKANPQLVKKYSRWNGLKYKYGITREQYDELLLGQGGKCAICRREPKGRPLGVDHKHGTKIVRGLLCNRCNSYLEFFEVHQPIIEGYLQSCLSNSPA